MTTLKHGDLKGCIYPEISVDEYEAKIGNTDEVIVVAFYVMEEDVGVDLDDFLEKSWVEILDVDISPNPTEDGKYMVFLEFTRDADFFKKLHDVIGEVENLSGPMEWKITTRGHEGSLIYDQAAIQKLINVSTYMPMSVEESLQLAKKFMDGVSALVETVDNKLKLSCGREHLYMDVVKFGNFDQISEEIKHIPLEIGRESRETRVLKSILGEEWDVLQLNGHIALQNINSDDILIVRV